MARQLERSYSYYNRKYFDNSLPVVPIQWSKKKIPSNCFGYYLPGEDEHGMILLSTEMRNMPNLWRMTLLHEMCHVKLRDHIVEARSSTFYHSRPWKKEMRRLAAIGAFDRLWSLIVAWEIIPAITWYLFTASLIS